MTRVLDVLEDYLDWRGYEHLRLDGAVSSAERGDLVKRFNDPGDLQHRSDHAAIPYYKQEHVHGVAASKGFTLCSLWPVYPC